MRRYLILAAALIVAGTAWLLYAGVGTRKLQRDINYANKQLAAFRETAAKVNAARAAIRRVSRAPDQHAVDAPLIPFLEAQAHKLQVGIRGIEQRKPIVNRRAASGGDQMITEEQTWVQVEKTPLKKLVLFLNAIESGRPDYFVKELSSLTPSGTGARQWRVQVILARIRVTDADTRPQL